MVGIASCIAQIFFKKFKAFGEFVAILHLLFMFWILGTKACRILAPRPGIEPTALALEGAVLTTELPGESPNISISSPALRPVSS